MRARALLFVFLAVIVGASVAGCPGALHVQSAWPTPNLDLPAHSERLALKLEDDVLDSYDLPEQNGVRKAFVREWRTTLIRGFRAAYEKSFTLDDDRHDYVVQLVEARLEFGHTAMGLTAIVRYKARLLNATTGEVVERFAGAATSKTGGHTDEATKLAGSAVESMYEAIGKAFFAAPLPKPGVSASGSSSSSSSPPASP